MKTTISLMLRANNSMLRQNCRRQVLPYLRRSYVNWNPNPNDWNKKNKKGKTPLPSGDPQSPAELDKAFQPPSSTKAEHYKAEQPKTESQEAEPRLLRLKNNKTFNQWEEEWTERVWRAGQLTLIFGVLLTAYAIGSGYVPLPYGMNYRASKMPAEGSEEEKMYLKQVENKLHSLPLVQQLSQDPAWIKTIGIFPIPKDDAVHNLTMGVLAGSGRITVKPITFYNDKTKEFVVVMHVGQDLCGHRGLVHGGFLATMLDECLGKTVCPREVFANKRLLRPFRKNSRMGRDELFGPRIELLSLQI